MKKIRILTCFILLILIAAGWLSSYAGLGGKSIVQLKAACREHMDAAADYEERRLYERAIEELTFAAEIEDSDGLQNHILDLYEKWYAEENSNDVLERYAEAARKAAEEAAKKAAEEAAKQQASSSSDSESSSTSSSSSSTKTYAPAGEATGANIAAYACQFVGNPYVFGGTSLTDGCDCSGFVYSVYKAFGISVPRTSYALNSAGTEVAYEDAQPGDVIVYAGHCAIYLGNGRIVHASTERTGIKYGYATYRTITSVRRFV